MSVSQGVSYTPEESNGTIAKRETDDNLQVGTTRLSAMQTLPEYGDLSFSASLSIGFYNSEYYRDQTRETDVSLSTTANWQALEWVGLSLTPGYVNYQHKKKLANDEVGAFVARDLLSLSAALNFKLYFEGLNASLNYGTYKTDYFGNREDAYSYATGARLSYAFMKQLSVNAGISNSRNQVENDDIAPVVLLNKDLTMIDVGLNYTIF